MATPSTCPPTWFWAVNDSNFKRAADAALFFCINNPSVEKLLYRGVIFLIRKCSWGLIFAGACAGAVAGLFGSGGGMVLVPLLGVFGSLEEQEVFPASLSIILPVCLVSLSITAAVSGLPCRESIPYLLGSAGGGVLAGIWGKKIPVMWLHRGLGILILWGGWRYLWH